MCLYVCACVHDCVRVYVSACDCFDISAFLCWCLFAFFFVVTEEGGVGEICREPIRTDLENLFQVMLCFLRMFIMILSQRLSILLFIDHSSI